MSSLVVKRDGRDEKFDERKLYASIFMSLRLASATEKEAELISSEVIKLVSRWINAKTHVSSHDIRLEGSKILRDYNHLAAYIYSNHRVLS